MPQAATPARLIALEGPSGVGKSRLAEELAARIPDARILSEAYDRLGRRPSLVVPSSRQLLRLELRLLREERRRWEEARRELRRGRNVVADTGFVGPLTYAIGLGRLDPRREVVVAPLAAAYLGAPGRRGLGWPSVTIYLDAPAGTVAARATGDPGAHPGELRDRHARVGLEERRLWLELLGPRLGPRFVRISARGDPEAVADRALRALRRTAGLPRLTDREAEATARSACRALRERFAILKKGSRRGPTPRR